MKQFETATLSGIDISSTYTLITTSATTFSMIVRVFIQAGDDNKGLAGDNNYEMSVWADDVLIGARVSTVNLESGVTKRNFDGDYFIPSGAIIKVKFKGAVTDTDVNMVVRINYGSDIASVDGTDISSADDFKATGFATSGSLTTVEEKIDIVDAKVDLIKTETDKIKYILGLVQSNFSVSNQTFDGNNNLTGATVKTYLNSVDLEADENILGTYTLTAQFNSSSEITLYKMVKN